MPPFFSHVFYKVSDFRHVPLCPRSSVTFSIRSLTSATCLCAPVLQSRILQSLWLPSRASVSPFFSHVFYKVSDFRHVPLCRRSSVTFSIRSLTSVTCICAPVLYSRILYSLWLPSRASVPSFFSHVFYKVSDFRHVPLCPRSLFTYSVQSLTSFTCLCAPSVSNIYKSVLHMLQLVQNNSYAAGYRCTFVSRQDQTFSSEPQGPHWL